MEKRSEKRGSCNIPSFYKEHIAAVRFACTVIDINATGAKIRLETDEKPPKTFYLSMPVLDDIWDERRVELRWTIGDVAGVRFLEKDDGSAPAKSET